MRKVLFVLAAIIVAMMFAAPVVAQEDDNTEGIVGNELPTDEAEDIDLPGWVQNLAVGGFALAPLVVAVAQGIKVIGRKTGLLPDGTTGYVVLALSFVAVVVAGLADIMNASEQVGLNAETLLHVAEAMLTFFAALGWYEKAKQAEVIK